MAKQKKLVPIRTPITEHFSREEFACRCGCGSDDISLRLVSALESVRLHLGVPLKVTCGVRCPAHNAAVGGAPNSNHMHGIAADVTCEAGVQAIYRAAIRVPILAEGGIILYPQRHFVHLDVRQTKYHRANIGGKYLPIEAALLAPLPPAA